MRVVWKLSNLVQTSFELQFSKTSLLLNTTSNELWILRNFVAMQVRIINNCVHYLTSSLWVRVIKLLIHIKDSEEPPIPTNHINPFNSVSSESHSYHSSIDLHSEHITVWKFMTLIYESNLNITLLILFWSLQLSVSVYKSFVDEVSLYFIDHKDINHNFRRLCMI